MPKNKLNSPVFVNKDSHLSLKHQYKLPSQVLAVEYRKCDGIRYVYIVIMNQFRFLWFKEVWVNKCITNLIPVSM